MRTKPLLLLPLCLVLLAGAANADYMQIKFRSGAVQTIRLDGPSSGIVSISYQDTIGSAIEPSAPPTAKTGATGTSGDNTPTADKNSDKQKSDAMPAVRIEWASPME